MITKYILFYSIIYLFFYYNKNYFFCYINNKLLELKYENLLKLINVYEFKITR
jgi:hypothetical protein